MKKFYFYSKGIRIAATVPAIIFSLIAIALVLLRIFAEVEGPYVEILFIFMAAFLCYIAVGCWLAKVVFDYEKEELRIFDIFVATRKKFAKIDCIEILHYGNLELRFSVNERMFTYGLKMRNTTKPTKENTENMAQIIALLFELKEKYGC